MNRSWIWLAVGITAGVVIYQKRRGVGSGMRRTVRGIRGEIMPLQERVSDGLDQVARGIDRLNEGLQRLAKTSDFILSRLAA